MHASKMLSQGTRRGRGSELESQPVFEVLLTVKVSIYGDYDKNIHPRLPWSQRRG
jgi:hypothetical protein